MATVVNGAGALENEGNAISGYNDQDQFPYQIVALIVHGPCRAVQSYKMPRVPLASPKRLHFPAGNLKMPLGVARKRVRSTETGDSSELRELFGTKWMTIPKLKEVEKQTGRRYKRGKFSRCEQEAVDKTLQEHLRANNLTRDQFIDRIRNATDKARTKKSALFTEIASKLEGRPVLTVYHYVKRQYHPGNRMGLWTPEEDRLLKRYFAEYGPQWEVIGRALDRFNTACRDRYRAIRNEYSSGRWSSEESQRLAEAVDEAEQSRNLHSVWLFVSERVHTRSPMQCLQKWQESVMFRQRNAAAASTRARWSREQDLVLISRLYEMALEDESEIVWRKLISDEWNRWTPTRLRNRWKQLKKRVEGVERMDLDTILETLMNSLRALSPDYIDSDDEEQTKAAPRHIV